MALRTRIPFKKRSKGLIIVVLLVLFLAVYYGFFWRTFAPIPSTRSWPAGNDIIVFYGDVFITPVTMERGLFFFDIGEKKLVRWESVMTDPHSYGSIAWVSQRSN